MAIKEIRERKKRENEIEWEERREGEWKRQIFTSISLTTFRCF
jgi:hypothetical protein